ncbi:tyrosine recombinase domain protein [Burkholderia pseudomallei]|nr:tyrosine recombinase domain protein [Burkholderia pseudomallei]
MVIQMALTPSVSVGFDVCGPRRQHGDLLPEGFCATLFGGGPQLCGFFAGILPAVCQAFEAPRLVSCSIDAPIFRSSNRDPNGCPMQLALPNVG